ncbi:MAG: RsmB/NOP family class I SAM-dependent RNA methyltransferase [Candidatus Odinarchaeia archaeon]
MDNLEFKARFLAKKYGYPKWMVRRYLELFGGEITDFLEASNKPLLKSIRVNTLKIDEESLVKNLEKKGFRLKPINWVDHGYFVLKEPTSIGATVEYLRGYYFVQTTASMIPPPVLDPQKNEIVLDMCAAPGGKTTHLAQLMENTGVIIAIEISEQRIISLKNNLSRCSVNNSILLNMDANEFSKFNYKVDKILLDAPCTGEGIIREKPERKHSRQIKDILFCSKNQKRLIDSAVNSLKKGGTLVYSTCSIAPEENEEIIDYALERYPLKVEPIDIIGDPGLTTFEGKKYSPSLKNAKRIYPHKHESIGFFICKLTLEGEIG